MEVNTSTNNVAVDIYMLGTWEISFPRMKPHKLQSRLNLKLANQGIKENKAWVPKHARAMNIDH